MSTNKWDQLYLSSSISQNLEPSPQVLISSGYMILDKTVEKFQFGFKTYQVEHYDITSLDLWPKLNFTSNNLLFGWSLSLNLRTSWKNWTSVRLVIYQIAIGLKDFHFCKFNVLFDTHWFFFNYEYPKRGHLLILLSRFAADS